MTAGNMIADPVERERLREQTQPARPTGVSGGTIRGWLTNAHEVTKHTGARSEVKTEGLSI